MSIFTAPFSSSSSGKQPSPVPIKFKSPAELVTLTEAALTHLDEEQLIKCILALKSIMCEEDRTDTETQNLIYFEVIKKSLFSGFVEALPQFSFELRKEVFQILTTLLRFSSSSSKNTPLALHLFESESNILERLVLGYLLPPETALFTGMLLRECLKHEFLVIKFLNSGEIGEGNNAPYFDGEGRNIAPSTEPSLLYKLFEFVLAPNYDIASDSFATARDLVMRHKHITVTFIETNLDKLLSEMMLDRSYYGVMTKYITSSSNMKLMMNLLRDKSHNIQYEAFQVFKVCSMALLELFIANPEKPKQIFDIISNNKEKLLSYLNGFEMDFSGQELEQFSEEKVYLISQIEAVPSKKSIDALLPLIDGTPT